MAFQSWDDAGNLLFNTNNMTYGLVASGNLSRINNWYRWSLRSAQLDPNNPANYTQIGPYDAVFGFSVVNSIAPIAFINGEGMYAGSQRSGNVTTFYYIFSSANTRIYIFDVMRDIPIAAGMKCYADDAANTCTFNSAQVPLNIVAVHQCPPPSPPTSNNYYPMPISGGSKRYERLLPNNEYTSYMVVRCPIAIGANNYAVATTFSRSMSMGRHDSFSPLGGLNLAYSNYMGAFDGCWGTAGGIVWAVTDAARTQMIPASTAIPNGYANIPQDRYPQALVVSIDNLPIPYSAY